MEIVNEGTVTSPAGFTAGTALCYIKASRTKPDVAVVASARPCTAAGLFTQSQVVAAPVTLDQETLAHSRQNYQAVVVNAGNANACTGEPGLQNAQEMQKLTAQVVGCQPGQVLVMSTGVIGVQLPMDKVAQGIQTAGQALSPAGGYLAAEAICTTDTFAKQTAVQVQLPAGVVTIGGIAKGAGMIHPNMATMLSLITTDAEISAELLQKLLTQANNHSFNRISVDGDTSTNDTVLVLANGASGVVITAENQALFLEALTHLCQTLAKLIVRDGEGATKFIELKVSGTPSEAEAHQIANAIATSPLVKTAFAGSDANWGRIFAAAGRAGVRFDQTQTQLHISQDGQNWLTLLTNGTPTHYEEKDAAAIFAQKEIWVWLEVGAGEAAAVVWTCDLTHEYVSINADYRT